MTITKDACVRLWELDSNNRNSFDEPSLAVDLKKLGNALSTREDFSASKFGANKGYTVDDIEMQVASGCFGGEGKDDEDGWSSMTLWVAMTEGDVYALCPFLPTYFWAPASLLPSLTTSVVAKTRLLEQDSTASETYKRVADQQFKWLAELDKQDPTVIPGALGAMEVFARPERPGIVPKLQGPFQLSPEPGFGEVTDIHVVAPQINHEDLFGEDEEDDFDIKKDEGLSIGIVCLATNANQVHVCLNLEGVEAEWLPARRSRARLFDDVESEKELLLLETIECGEADQSSTTESWPTFTTSPADRYEVFTTQPGGIFNLSFRDWVSGLEDELVAAQKNTEGSSFRLKVLIDTCSTSVERITAEADNASQNMDAAIAVYEPSSDVGYVVLTASSNIPVATIIDIPAAASHPYGPDLGGLPEKTAAAPIRPAYQPPETFFKPSQFPAQLEVWRRESGSGARGDMKAQIRCSPWTLQRITEAHRILSSETHDLGVAAADLYRRCQRMITEMRDQIESVRALSNRIDSVTGEDNFSESVAGQPDFVRGGKQRIDARITESRQRTEELQQRVDSLRSKLRGVGGKELSAKERAFAAEVAALKQSILPAESEDGSSSAAQLVRMENSELTTSTASSYNPASADEDSVAARFRAIENVYKSLLEQSKDLQQKLGTSESKEADQPKVAAPGPAATDYRSRKMTQVFGLLDRETAMIEAVAERLRRLQT